MRITDENKKRWVKTLKRIKSRLLLSITTGENDMKFCWFDFNSFFYSGQVEDGTNLDWVVSLEKLDKKYGYELWRICWEGDSKAYIILMPKAVVKTIELFKKLY